VEKGKHIKPNIHTIYEIASVTKSFTGILLAHALLEKRISLDDEIVKYVPSLVNLGYQGEKVTIRNLANHTSGLPKFIPVPPKGSLPVNYWLHSGPISEQRFLDDLALFKPDFRPGTRFVYSNADTQLLGIILEKIYHLSYPELIKKYITGPAGMGDTGIAVSQKNKSRFAKGYDGNGAPAPGMTWWDMIPAATALKSSVADMLNYLQLNLNEHNPAIMLAHQPILKIGEEGADSIGLYWMNKTAENGSREVFHAGGSLGHTSFCLICPENQTAIVCLTNDAGTYTERELKKMAFKIVNSIN
jgi:CubicO group peptidase (beta-lactamase class C family)